MKEFNDTQNGIEIEETEKDSYGDLRVKDNKFMNTAAKILAVVCAVVIWFFAVGNESPHYEETYKNLTVDITGVPQGMSVMSGGGNLVDITVKGLRAEVSALEKEDIKVYADASAITTPGRYELPVTADLANGITVQSFSRDTVSVYISTASQKILPLTTKLVDYTMPPECTVKTTVKGEATITVFGPKDELEKIERASVVVSPGNLTSALTCSGQIKLYDASGEEYSNTYVTQSLHEAIVEVELMTVADIKLTVSTVHGYFTEDNTQITLTPPTIRVSGRYEDISGITTLNIYTIDETKIMSDAVLHVQPSLPVGMTLVDQISDVSISIKHTGTSVKTFTVPVSSITLTGQKPGFTYSPDFMGLIVKVRGENGSEFSSMTANDISVSVDVSACDLGITVVPAAVSVSSKNDLIYVLGEYTIYIETEEYSAETVGNV